MKLWVDNVRQPPNWSEWDDWYYVSSVDEAKREIEYFEKEEDLPFELIDVAHNCIDLVDWLEKTGRSYTINLHSR